ncbi:MAG: tetratricopeptide repeat protein [Chloroflexi bacterium]|nr:tetratricopeptide repeat protein [Chloroflexota bacterium]
MGAVYRAHDNLLDRIVAIKMLGAASLGAESRERLLREARAAARLNHPNIVGIYDVGMSEEDAPFIVMEMVEGQTLFDRPPKTIDETLAIVRQICAALDHAHAHGIVHRDLKLENILLAADGAVKLTDFGLARSIASRLTTDGSITGTVFYLAPELALGQPYDGRADLYALGVLLYELTTHKLPFDGDDPIAVVSQHLHAPVVPPRAHSPSIPPALDALIVRLLAKRPDDRPASASEVKSEIEHIAANAASGAAQSQMTAPRAELSLLDRIVRGRMVGREHELGEAASVWKRAASGESQALLVSGELGIGKTRLVRELVALAEVSGAFAFTGECNAEGGPPYAPFAQILQTALARPSNERAGEASTAMAAQLPPLVLADLITLAPALRARFPNAPPNPPLDPQAEQQRIMESVVEWCAALSARAPALFVFDDAHWADSGTLVLARHLVRRARASKLRLLVALTYREIELSEAHPLNDALAEINRGRLATRIKLARLSREQTEALLRVMFEEDILPDFLDGIYRETEGNPFFIEEVCKALIEEGQLTFADGRWRRPSMDQVRVPQSVRIAIQARVSKLPVQTQEVLRLAAVFGREFEFALLQRASELNEESLIESVEIASRAQLIDEVRDRRRAGSERFVFAHAIIPAALRESVSGLRRHRLHRRAAAALESIRPDDFESLAYHFAEAGDEASARNYYVQAGDRARRLYANADAIRFYSEALALLPADDPARFDVLAARAAVHEVAADRDTERADAHEMLMIAERLNDNARRFEALIALADLRLETDHFRAFEPLEKALSIARALGDAAREARALRRLGWLNLLRGDYTRCRAVIEEAVARFRAANLIAETATCLHILSLALSHNGDIAEARQVVEESIVLSRAIGDPRQEAIGLRRLGIILGYSGDMQGSIDCTQQALVLHRALGDRAQECNALSNLSVWACQLGQWEEARDYTLQALEIGEAIDSHEAIIKAIHHTAAYYPSSPSRRLTWERLAKRGRASPKRKRGSARSAREKRKQTSPSPKRSLPRSKAARSTATPLIPPYLRKGWQRSRKPSLPSKTIAANL